MSKNRPARHEELNALLAEFRQHTADTIPHWNAFCRTVDVPVEFAVAVCTGRDELTRLAKPRALTEQECKVVYDLISVLVKTNFQLQRHCQRTAQLVDVWGQSFKQLGSLGLDITNFANFRDVGSSQEGEADGS